MTAYIGRRILQMIPLVFVLAIAYWFWTNYLNADPPPVRIFKSAAEAWVAEDMATIRPYCRDPAVENAFERRSAGYLMGRQGIGQIVSFEYNELVLDSGEAENVFIVKAKQTVWYNPPGVDSEGYASWYAVFDHSMRVSVTADEWQIDNFAVHLTENKAKGYD